MKTPCRSLLRLSKLTRAYILQVHLMIPAMSSLPLQNTVSGHKYNALELKMSFFSCANVQQLLMPSALGCLNFFAVVFNINYIILNCHTLGKKDKTDRTRPTFLLVYK